MRLDGVTLRGPIPFRFQCPAAAAVQFGATESFCKACDKTIHHVGFGEDLAKYRGQCVKIDRQMLKMGGFIGARRVAVVASSEEAFANEWAKMLEAIKVAAPKLKGRGRDRHNTGVEVPRIITDSDTLLMADHALPNTVTKMFPRLAMMLDNSSYSTDIGAEERLVFHKVIVTPGSAVGAAAQEDVMKSNTGLFAFEHILVLDETTAQPLKQIGALRPALDVAGKYRRVMDETEDICITRVDDYERLEEAASTIVQQSILPTRFLGRVYLDPERTPILHDDGRTIEFKPNGKPAALDYALGLRKYADSCGESVVEKVVREKIPKDSMFDDQDVKFQWASATVKFDRGSLEATVSPSREHFAFKDHVSVKPMTSPPPSYKIRTTPYEYCTSGTADTDWEHHDAYLETLTLFRKLDGYILGTQSYIQAQARVLKSDKSEARATERDEVQSALSAIGTGRRFLEKEYPGGLRLDSASMSEKELMESATADEWKALSDRCQAELDAVAAGCVPVLERIEAERAQN